MSTVNKSGVVVKITVAIGSVVCFVDGSNTGDW